MNQADFKQYADQELQKCQRYKSIWKRATNPRVQSDSYPAKDQPYLIWLHPPKACNFSSLENLRKCQANPAFRSSPLRHLSEILIRLIFWTANLGKWNIFKEIYLL